MGKVKDRGGEMEIKNSEERLWMNKRLRRFKGGGKIDQIYVCG